MITFDQGITPDAQTGVIQETERPYTSYLAIVTQTAEAAPSAVVAESGSLGTLTWARTATGSFSITAVEPVFITNKTYCTVGRLLGGVESGSFAEIYPSSTTVIVLNTYIAESGSYSAAKTDALLSSTPVEIKVY